LTRSTYKEINQISCHTKMLVLSGEQSFTSLSTTSHVHVSETTRLPLSHSDYLLLNSAKALTQNSLMVARAPLLTRDLHAINLTLLLFYNSGVTQHATKNSLTRSIEGFAPPLIGATVAWRSNRMSLSLSHALIFIVRCAHDADQCCLGAYGLGHGLHGLSNATVINNTLILPNSLTYKCKSHMVFELLITPSDQK
jgi:hypothetical protein